MAESIDELQIKVEAEASGASTSLSGLTEQLTRLSSAVDKLNVNKLNSLATTLNNIGNIKLTDSSKQIQNLNKEIDNLTKNASKNLSKDLIDTFNVADSKTKTSIRSISDSIMELEKDMELHGYSDESWKAVEKNIQDLVDVTSAGALGEVEDDVKRFHDEWMQLNRDAKGNPIYVDDIIRGDFSDQWKQMTTQEGDFIGKFTKDMSEAKMGVDDLYQELQSKYPELFPRDLTTGSEEFEQLISVVREYNKELRDTSSITQGLMTVPEAAQMDISKGISDYWKDIGKQLNSGSDMSATSEAYQNIISQLQAQSTEEQKGFAETVKGIQDIGAAVKNIPNDDRIEKLKESLEEFGDAVSKLEGVSSLADGISKLSGAIATIPKSNVFDNFVKSVDTLNKADVSNIDQIANRIDHLADSMAKFSSSREYNINLSLSANMPTDESADTTNDITKAVNELSDATDSAKGSVGEFTDAINEMADAETQATNSNSTLGKSVENVNDSTKQETAEMEKDAENKREARAITDALVNSVKEFGSALASVAKSIGNAGIAAFSDMMDSAAKGATKLGKNVKSATKELGKMVLQETPLANLGGVFDSLGHASDKLTHELSRLSRMFGNIIARTGFRLIMGEMDEAFQQLAVECEDVNSEVSRLMSLCSQLAHSITALAKPLLDIFGPALEYIIGLLNDAINFVNQFIAAITGQTYVTGKYVASDFAESLEDAADAADDAAASQAKLNKQLQGFNELNNLTTTESSSGTGSSGNSGGEYTGGYYEELPISQDIQDFVDKLKEAWENADFTEIGNIIGEKLKEALESIPWNEIQEGAQKLAHSLATLINGFIETEGLGETIGNTLGEAINTALIFADEFLTTIHWDNLGKFLADIVNGAIESVNWGLLGKTLGDAIAAWLETGFNYITNINWESLGENLATSVNNFIGVVNDALTSYDWAEMGRKFANGLNKMISNINWDELGEMVANAFNTVLSSISGAIESFNFKQLGTDLAKAMNSAVENADWSGIGTTIKNAINGIFQSIVTWASKFNFEQFGQNVATALNTALSGIDWNHAITAVEKIARGIAVSLKNLMTKETFENVGTALAEALNAVFKGIYKFIKETNWKELAENCAAGINQWVKKMDFEDIGRSLGSVIQAAIDFLVTLIKKIDWGEVAKSLLELLKGAASEVKIAEVGGIIAAALGAWLVGDLVTSIGGTLLKAAGSALISALGSAIVGVVGSIGLPGVAAAIGAAIVAIFAVPKVVEWFQGVDWNAIGNKIGDFFSNATQGVCDLVVGVKDNAKENWQKTKDYWQREIDKYGGYIGDFVTGVKDQASEWWSNTKSFWKKKVGEVEDFATNVKDDAVTWWDNTKTYWKGKVGEVEDFATGVKNEASTWWSNTKSYWKGKVGEVEDFATGVKDEAVTWWDNTKTYWKKKVGSVEDFATGVKDQADTWWSNTKNYWSKKVGSVESFATGVKDQASTWWSNTKSYWSKKVGKVEEFATDVKNQASSWWTNTKNYWSQKVGKVTEFTTNVKNQASEWWSNTKNYWSQKVGEVSSFTTSVKNTASSWWSDVKSWWKSKAGDAGTFVVSVKNSVSDWWSNVKSWWSNYTQNSSLSAKVKGAVDKTTNWWTSVKNSISNLVGTVTVAVRGSSSKAKGGVFQNGVWSDIPQYAEGTVNSGSMFIAGEAGAELVGHIGGRTEVLNESQLAAVMRYSVLEAVASLGDYLNAVYKQMAVCANGIIGAITVSYDTPKVTPQVAACDISSAKMSLADEYGPELDDIVSLLNQIADNTETPVEISADSRGIFRMTQKEAHEYKQRTGNMAFE